MNMELRYTITYYHTSCTMYTHVYSTILKATTVSLYPLSPYSTYFRLKHVNTHNLANIGPIDLKLNL